MLNPDDPSPAPVSTSPSQSTAVASSGIRTWLLALAAGLVAGAIGWSIGEATLVPEAGYSDKNKKIEVLPAELGLRNCTISFGALGAALGLALGLAGGLVGRSVPRAIVASLSGLLLGGAAGAGLSQVILPVYYDHLRDNELIYSLMVHCGIWGAAGAAAGLAYALGTGGWSALLRGLIGGAAGALIGAVIYELGGGLLFPQAMTDRPISVTPETRLMARLLVTVMAAVGIVLTTDSGGGAKRTEPGPKS